MSPKKGFTLIELLVVVSIIGLLSTLVLASVTTARNKAKAIITIQSLKQMVNALELYRNDHGEYPDPLAYGENDSSWCTPYGPGWDMNGVNAIYPGLSPVSDIDKNGNGISFLDPLVPNYISTTNVRDVDVNSLFLYGLGGSGGGGPCNCVRNHDAEYILIAYNITKVPGITDSDECDNPVIWDAGVCPTEMGPNMYCIIKHR